MSRMHGPLTPTGALRAWWAIAMVLAAAVVITVANVGYTTHVQREAEARQAEARREADQRWCALFDQLTSPAAPPLSEYGRALQEIFRQLRDSFGCGEGRP